MWSHQAEKWGDASNHCLAGLPRDLSPSTLPYNMVFARVPFTLTTCPDHLPRLNDPQQRVILPVVIYNCSVYLHGRHFTYDSLLWLFCDTFVSISILSTRVFTITTISGVWRKHCANSSFLFSSTGCFLLQFGSVPQMGD